jgi:hypothetical protein
MTPLAARLPQRSPPTPSPALPCAGAAGIPRASKKSVGSVLHCVSALGVRREPPVTRDRCQAAIGAASSESTKNDEIAPQSSDTFARDHESQSPSSHLLDELALHGYHPLGDEPDARPLPSSDAASLALEAAVEALSGLLPDLLWSYVNSIAMRIASSAISTTMKPRKARAG